MAHVSVHGIDRDGEKLVDDAHEAAVVEMGISNFGEMHRLTEMVRPTIAVMSADNMGKGLVSGAIGILFSTIGMDPNTGTVRFTFALHRKGMVKDTVHTTELDTVYMRGVEAIRDHDYELALTYLAPYQDYNTAVAYVALDRNLSALKILEGMPRTGPVDYMLALLYARQGDERKAVQYYLDACGRDRSYVSRGNLDPEISALIRRYNLHAEPADDDWGDLIQ